MNESIEYKAAIRYLELVGKEILDPDIDGLIAIYDDDEKYIGLVKPCLSTGDMHDDEVEYMPFDKFEKAAAKLFAMLDDELTDMYICYDACNLLVMSEHRGFIRYAHNLQLDR